MSKPPNLVQGPSATANTRRSRGLGAAREDIDRMAAAFEHDDLDFARRLYRSPTAV